MTDPESVRAGDVERQGAVDRLRDAYAQGALDVDEFEERLDTVHTAKTRQELAVLVADLPEPIASADPDHGHAGVLEHRQADSPHVQQSRTRTPLASVLVALALVAAGAFGVVSVRDADSVSIFGSQTITVDGSDPDVQVFNVFGSTSVQVDQDVSVANGVTAIMGSTDCASACSRGDADVRIGGFAVFGSVEID